MIAFAIFLGLLGVHVGAYEAATHATAKADAPSDCQPYNVGRVECGSRSGGNPAPRVGESVEVSEADGVRAWIREAEEQAPKYGYPR